MSLVTVIFLVRLSLLQHIQFAEVVQLLQDGTSMHFIARTFAVALSTVSRAWRRFQEMGDYTKVR